MNKSNPKKKAPRKVKRKRKIDLRVIVSLVTALTKLVVVVYQIVRKLPPV